MSDVTIGQDPLFESFARTVRRPSPSDRPRARFLGLHQLFGDSTVLDRSKTHCSSYSADPNFLRCVTRRCDVGLFPLGFLIGDPSDRGVAGVSRVVGTMLRRRRRWRNCRTWSQRKESDQGRVGEICRRETPSLDRNRRTARPHQVLNWTQLRVNRQIVTR